MLPLLSPRTKAVPLSVPPTMYTTDDTPIQRSTRIGGDSTAHTGPISCNVPSGNNGFICDKYRGLRLKKNQGQEERQCRPRLDLCESELLNLTIGPRLGRPSDGPRRIHYNLDYCNYGYLPSSPIFYYHFQPRMSPKPLLLREALNDSSYL